MSGSPASAAPQSSSRLAHQLASLVLALVLAPAACAPAAAEPTNVARPSPRAAPPAKCDEASRIERARALVAKHRLGRALAVLDDVARRCPDAVAATWAVRLDALHESGRRAEARALASRVRSHGAASPAARAAAGRALAGSTEPWRSPRAWIAAARDAGRAGDAPRARLAYERAAVAAMELAREEGTGDAEPRAEILRGAEQHVLTRWSAARRFVAVKGADEDEITVLDGTTREVLYRFGAPDAVELDFAGDRALVALVRSTAGATALVLDLERGALRIQPRVNSVDIAAGGSRLVLRSESSVRLLAPAGGDDVDLGRVRVALSRDRATLAAVKPEAAATVTFLDTASARELGVVHAKEGAGRASDVAEAVALEPGGARVVVAFRSSDEAAPSGGLHVFERLDATPRANAATPSPLARYVATHRLPHALRDVYFRSGGRPDTVVVETISSSPGEAGTALTIDLRTGKATDDVAMDDVPIEEGRRSSGLLPVAARMETIAPLGPILARASSVGVDARARIVTFASLVLDLERRAGDESVRSWGGAELPNPLAGALRMTPSNDGSTLVAVGPDKVSLFSMSHEGSPTAAPRAHPQVLTHAKDVVLAADAPILAYTTDTSVRVVDLKTMEDRSVATTSAAAARTRPLALHPNGRAIAWIDGPDVRMRHLAGKSERSLWDLGSSVEQLAISRGGALFLGGRSGVVAYEPMTHDIAKRMDPMNVTALAVSPDGLLAVGSDSSVKLVGADASSAELRGIAGVVQTITFGPGARAVVATSDRDAASIWSTATGALLARVNVSQNGTVDVATPEGFVEVLADGGAAPVVCRVGHRVYPRELCDDARVVRGLLRSVLQGEHVRAPE